MNESCSTLTIEPDFPAYMSEGNRIEGMKIIAANPHLSDLRVGEECLRMYLESCMESEGGCPPVIVNILPDVVVVASIRDESPNLHIYLKSALAEHGKLVKSQLLNEDGSIIDGEQLEALEYTSTFGIFDCAMTPEEEV